MGYPVDVQLDAPDRIDRRRPLVHWLLAIPHLIIAGALGSVGGAISVIGWFVIVFTGELPDTLANFHCLVIRYSTRAYSYALWLPSPIPTSTSR